MLTACSERPESPSILKEQSTVSSAPAVVVANTPAVERAEPAVVEPAPMDPEVQEAYNQVTSASLVEVETLQTLSSTARQIIEIDPERVPFEAYDVVHTRLQDFENGVAALGLRIENFHPADLQDVAKFEAKYQVDLASVQDLYEDVHDVMLGIGILEQPVVN